MAVAAVSAPDFRMGRVVQRTFDVIGRNFWLFAVMAFVLIVPGTLLQSAAAPGLGQGRNVGLFSLGSLLGLLGYFVLQAAIIHATVTDLNGTRPSAADALGTGLRQFLPVIGVGLLYVLGVSVGIVLLIVPGMIWAIMWCLAIPVRVVERTSVGEAFGRSRFLTRGYRWNIFGLLLVYYILAWIFGMTLGAVAGVAASFEPGAGFFSPAFLLPLFATILATIIGAVVGTTGFASLYYELRVAKEGIGPEALAAVFD
jgi:hypothetical protein